MLTINHALAMFRCYFWLISCSYTSQFNIFHKEEFLNVTGLSKMRLPLEKFENKKCLKRQKYLS